MGPTWVLLDSCHHPYFHDRACATFLWATGCVIKLRLTGVICLMPKIPSFATLWYIRAWTGQYVFSGMTYLVNVWPFTDLCNSYKVTPCNQATYYITTKLLGGILVSLRPSVCLSVPPSIRPASHVCSVAPTVLVGSISYFYILPTNFRRCVACNVSCKIWIFDNFVRLVTLSCSDLGSDDNH